MYVCAYSSVQLDKNRVDKEFTIIIVRRQPANTGKKAEQLAYYYHYYCKR